MIRINGKIIDIGHFPDGTLLLKELADYRDNVVISWNYENNEELVALYFLTKHLKDSGLTRIILDMPYIPNARQDRVKNPEDVFTLKYFADIINTLEFSEVRVLDAHSQTSLDLIKNVVLYSPKQYIERVLMALREMNGRVPLMFYPDAGAGNRYDGMLSLPYCYGVKRRNWETGIIEGLDVEGQVNLIKDNEVLIVDDICSYGGTFYHSAKKLKEMGAKDVYLYVTHCENSILKGDLIKSDYVKKIFTTDSIAGNLVNERIEIINI